MDFDNFIRANGLIPGAIHPDGRIRRCPTTKNPRHKNGAYMLAVDGQFGWIRDWSTQDSSALWFADGTTEEGKARTVDWERIRRERVELREEQKRATKAARSFFESCAPLLGGHPYLEAHGLDMTGCYGLRVDADGWLVIPALRKGQVTSLQRISPEGQKLFWAGAPMRGVWYAIERPAATITVLCEGIATGLAIFAAAPQSRVIAAFSAGNMVKVAQTLAFSGLVVVAADNDHDTEQKIGKNPGVVAAREAAGVLGCGVMIPKVGPKRSDWADFRMDETSRRRDNLPYGSRKTPLMIQREVDALIATEVQRHADFAKPRSC